MTAKMKRDRDLIGETARECLEAADGDWKKAANLYRRKLNRDAALRKALLAKLADAAIWDAIAKAAHVDRRHAWAGSAQARGGEGIEDAVSEERASRRSLYLYPLRGGLPLGEATADQLREEIEWHVTLVRTNALRVRFYEFVLKRLKNGGRVRDAVSEDELSVLMDKAKEEE